MSIAAAKVRATLKRSLSDPGGSTTEQEK